MSDLVERLRRTELWQYQEGVPCEVGEFQSSLGEEAADEIERLRAALQVCLRYFEGDWDGEPEDAERIATARVRAALAGEGKMG